MTNKANEPPWDQRPLVNGATQDRLRDEVLIALDDRWSRTVGNMWTEEDERARWARHTEAAARSFGDWQRTIERDAT